MIWNHSGQNLIFKNSHQQLSLSKNPEFHEYNLIFIKILSSILLHIVSNPFLLFLMHPVSTETNKVASLVPLSIYDRAFWERLMSEMFVPGRPLNSALQFDFKLHLTTLNSYLRVADKNVIFFPHNYHNFHISLMACNRLFSWQDYWN